jgi:hypothetical protein
VIQRHAFFGAHVTRAARIKPSAKPGTAVVRGQFRAALHDSDVFDAVFIGELQLAKGYGSEKLYELGVRTERSVFNPDFSRAEVETALSAGTAAGNRVCRLRSCVTFMCFVSYCTHLQTPFSQKQTSTNTRSLTITPALLIFRCPVARCVRTPQLARSASEKR